MGYSLLSLLVASFITAYLWLRHHYTYWKQEGVPFEQPIYFMGNMWGIGKKFHFRDINDRIYKRFKGKGPVVGLYAFLQRVALVTDFELIKLILVKDFASFSDRGLFHNARDDPLTGNLLLADGADWSFLRHKLSPVFTSGKLRTMLSTVAFVGDRLIDACNDILGRENTVGDIEITELCARYTTDVIGVCAFGLECDSLRDPNAKFRCMGRAVFSSPRHKTIVETFMFSNPKFARSLRLKYFRDDISDFFIGAVRETVAFRRQNNVSRNDFMDQLIALLEGDPTATDMDKRCLTILQVAAQAMIFFLAGFETSSMLMYYCLYELALQPDIQEKLRTEICQVLEKHGGRITYEALQEMHYLEMVVSETLRQHTLVPHIPRVVTKTYCVPNTNIVLPEGLRIFIPIHSIHHDPEFYPSPEKFDPERFTAEAIKERHPMAYLPFGDGPRNCIGLRFGKVQSKIGLIQLLKHFKFDISKLTEVPLKMSNTKFMPAPQNGITLQLTKL